MTESGAPMLLLAAAFIATSPAAAASQFGTPEQQEVLIANVCGTQLPVLGAAGCACLAERAMGELDEPQRDYLILTVVQPPAAERTDMARSQADLKTIAGFLSASAQACGGSAPAATPRAPAGGEAEAPAPSAADPAQ